MSNLEQEFANIVHQAQSGTLNQKNLSGGLQPVSSDVKSNGSKPSYIMTIIKYSVVLIIVIVIVVIISIVARRILKTNKKEDIIVNPKWKKIKRKRVSSPKKAPKRVDDDDDDDDDIPTKKDTQFTTLAELEDLDDL